MHGHQAHLAQKDAAHTPIDNSESSNCDDPSDEEAWYCFLDFDDLQCVRVVGRMHLQLEEYLSLWLVTIDTD
eukprot:2746891-Lingulodinium_polyedra.AAC.1